MIVANPQPGLTKSEFEQVLHSALNGLYNPAILHSSLLIGWLGLSQSENPEYLLRKVLLDSIEALYPNYEIPSGSKTWRVYQILRRRFIEQILQRKVAGELGISLRQLQREEKIAREILGDYVWKTYQLEESKPSELNSATSSTAHSQASLPDSGDLQWLRENLPVLDVNLSDVIQDGLHTLIGICDSSGIQVEYHCQEPNPVLFLQPSLFRQGLLNLLITIIQFVPGGKIRIQAYNQTEKIVIDIEAIPSIDHRGQNSRGITEGLNTAGLFFNCCNGSIEIEDPTDTTPLRVRIALPILERMAVLVVEDHADTLHLFQRYLADSRYIFWGASSVNEGLALAEAILPRVIVLDVMMPESDGWEFLGRLHVHPKLMHIPVIVYSIVSQENLALSLGAAEFLQKPISRKELLAALDRQVTRSSRESG